MFLLQKKPCFWDGMENELTGGFGWGKVFCQKEGMEFVHCPFHRVTIGSVTLHTTAVHGAISVLRVSEIESNLALFPQKVCPPF